jgi:4'-phosphopantetheinyl transferase
VSLSHCASAVVAVASVEGRLGVDVEPLDGSAERAAAIASVAGAGGIRRWTSVEAVLKCDGRGLRVDPRGVEVTTDSATLGDARYELWHPALAVDLQATIAWRA